MSKILPTFLIAAILLFAYVIASWSPGSQARSIVPKRVPAVVQVPASLPAAPEFKRDQGLPPR